MIVHLKGSTVMQMSNVILYCSQYIEIDKNFGKLAVSMEKRPKPLALFCKYILEKGLRYSLSCTQVISCTACKVFNTFIADFVVVVVY